jgi:hypothetical protein
MRIVIILIFICVGCSSTKEQSYKQNLDQVYIGSGVERLYLSDLPSWANISTIASCRRKEPIRYLNFENMYKSYSMSYESLIQFQYMLNRKFASYKLSTGRPAIFLKDESFIMHNVHEQIIGGGRDFIVPKFKRIHLVWIDQFFSNKDKLKKLKSLMSSSKMEKGHPIFVSTCLSSIELEKFISTNGFNKYGVKLISQEMFTPYGTDLKLAGNFTLNFSLLMPGKDLHFYGEYMPKEFFGIIDKNIHLF